MDFPKNIPANFAAAPARTAHCGRRQEPPPPFSHCFPIVFQLFSRPFAAYRSSQNFYEFCRPRSRKWRLRDAALESLTESEKFLPIFSSPFFWQSLFQVPKKILRLHSRHIAQYGFRKTQRDWKNFSSKFLPPQFLRQSLADRRRLRCSPLTAPPPHHAETARQIFNAMKKRSKPALPPKKATEGVFKRAQKTKPETRRNPI